MRKGYRLSIIRDITKKNAGSRRHLLISGRSTGGYQC
jgi:hypothetical protein